MEERARRFGEIVGGPWAGRSEAAGSGSSSFVSGRQTRRLIAGQSGHGFRPIWNLPKTIATIVSNWLGATTTGRIDEGAPRPRGRGARPGEVRVGGSPWSLGCTNPRMHTIFAFWRQPDMLEPLIRYVRLARTDEVERDVGRLASKKQSGTVLEPCLSSARWFSLSHSGLSAPHPPHCQALCISIHISDFIFLACTPSAIMSRACDVACGCQPDGLDALVPVHTH